MTTHKETQEALDRIKQLKQELAKLMFTHYMSLEAHDRPYADLFMDDSDIGEV